MIIFVWRKHQFFSGCFFHIDWPAYSLAHSDNHKVLMVLQQIAISETLCVVTIFFIPILMFGCSRRNGLIEFGNGFEQNPMRFMQLHVLQDVLETQKVVIWNLGQRLWSRRSEGVMKIFESNYLFLQYRYNTIMVTLSRLCYCLFCIFEEG